MSALEQEIIEKFHLLESEAKQRVLEILTLDAQTSFDYGSWWARVEVLQASIRAQLGEGKTVGALSLLDELPEEQALDDDDESVHESIKTGLRDIARGDILIEAEFWEAVADDK